MGRNKQFSMSEAAKKAWATRRKKDQTESNAVAKIVGLENLSPAQKAWLTRKGGQITKRPWELEHDPRFPEVNWYVAKDSKGEPLAYAATENETQATQLLRKHYPTAKVSLCLRGKCPF